MANYKTEITAIMEKGGLCSRKEYDLLRKELKSKAPCNLLVFGLGHESEWLAKLNEGGRTIFVENSMKWIEANKGKGLEIVYHDYQTKLLNDGKLYPLDKFLIKTLPFQGVEFDVVFVDAPIGRTQGRMASIVTGFAMCKEGGVMLVHDINRATEKMYTDAVTSGVYDVVDRMAIVRK